MAYFWAIFSFANVHEKYSGNINMIIWNEWVDDVSYSLTDNTGHEIKKKPCDTYDPSSQKYWR